MADIRTSEILMDSTSIINKIIDSAPATLDTLNEIAAALGDDANFATTIINSLATKAVYPSQTGNAGKFLTTDGTSASWSTVDTSSMIITQIMGAY